MVSLPDVYSQSHGCNQPHIVAHRGATDRTIGNTLPAFLRALELGADAVEMDVRLTSDQVPVVFHNFYLDGISSLNGPIFEHTWSELRKACLYKSDDPEVTGSISTLQEVLDNLDGRIGMEIEIKGPEIASVEAITAILKKYPYHLSAIEITSSEPMLLERFRSLFPGIPTDLLIPLSEPWMKSDVLAYTALQRGRLAGARAVHLHASQLSDDAVSIIRNGGCEVHAWGINDPGAFAAAWELQIPRLCTDNLQQILKYHEDTRYETIH